MEDMNSALFMKIIKQKEAIIEEKNKTIKQKDETIEEKNKIIKEKNDIIEEKNKLLQEKNEIISDLKEKILKLNKNQIKEDELDNNNINKKDENIDYNKIFKNFNIINLTAKNKLTYHNNYVYSIIQLQDRRLASAGEDGSIKVMVDLAINEHQGIIYNIIQLKNGNILSCGFDDKKINMYKLIDTNNYELLSKFIVANNCNPTKLLELDNGQIALVADTMINFYLNLNNELEEDFNIKPDANHLTKFYDIIKVKPGELVFGGDYYPCRIQFFEINSRKLKEKIVINSYIFSYRPFNTLYKVNDRCLCVGGSRNITIIDIYNKSIIREIEIGGYTYTFCKLIDNILLSGYNSNIIQWKITQNNLQLISQKENVHQSTIIEIIKFGNSIVTCSLDKSIKIW